MKNKTRNLIDIKFYSKTKILKILERTSLLLKIYRSGKVPKLLKSLPMLKNFEEILWLLRPDSWSPQALYIITRLFVSRLDNLQMGRFLSQILAPRLQEAVFRSKKISSHLFLSLKVSTNRSKNFFSSLLFPILRGQSCTLKEAIILGSIINRASFLQENVIWSLINLLDDPCTPPKLILIRIFLSKNYTLPYRVLDILLDFFFKNSVISKNSNFKKCVFIFFRNYSNFISNEDKKRIYRMRILNYQK